MRNLQFHNAFSHLTPQVICAVILATSLLALAAAFTAEFGFHLIPCILCLAQRVPFALAILISAGVLLSKKCHRPALVLLTLLFLLNTSIAVFQVGEEQKWWGVNATGDSQVCTAPNVAVQNIEDLYQSMSGNPLGDCAHPAFSFHGITFAVMNAFLCLFLCGLAVMGITQLPIRNPNINNRAT